MTRLCFIDTETTGLNPNVHQAYEVAWAIDDEAVQRVIPPHTLENADMQALAIGDYFGRKILQKHSSENGVRHLTNDLRGVTLVGSNPAFDAAFLTRTIGVAVWHHRMIDVAAGAMWVLGWDRPKGLADVANELRTRGHSIPEPDHTAVGDVETTRAVFIALRLEATQ